MLPTFILTHLVFLTAQGAESLSQNTPPGASLPPTPMPLAKVVFLTFYYFCLAVIGLAQMMALWPESQHLDDKSEIRLFWYKTWVHRETHLALIVILMGLLGGVANDLSWLGHQTTMGELEARRFIAYLIQPWLAATVALIFYSVLRGGLISGPGSGKEVNAYGIAGVSGAVGIFAERVISKLGGVLK